MEALVGAAMATAVGGVSSIWEYNQGNWQFDQGQRQSQLHQLQNMRVSQASMYREDVRDLFGLTIAKMDSYLTINTLQLGFCISLYYDGRLNQYCPTWLFVLHGLSLGSAFIFFVLSMWFSVYASIAAHSCVVRTLTQALRVPVPGIEDMREARAFASDYEHRTDVAFRVPFLQKMADAKAAEEKSQLERLLQHSGRKIGLKDEHFAQLKSGDYSSLYQNTIGSALNKVFTSPAQVTVNQLRKSRSSLFGSLPLSKDSLTASQNTGARGRSRSFMSLPSIGGGFSGASRQSILKRSGTWFKRNRDSSRDELDPLREGGHNTQSQNMEGNHQASYNHTGGYNKFDDSVAYNRKPRRSSRNISTHIGSNANVYNEYHNPHSAMEPRASLGHRLLNGLKELEGRALDKLSTWSTGDDFNTVSIAPSVSNLGATRPSIPERNTFGGLSGMKERQSGCPLTRNHLKVDTALIDLFLLGVGSAGKGRVSRRFSKGRVETTSSDRYFLSSGNYGEGSHYTESPYPCGAQWHCSEEADGVPNFSQSYMRKVVHLNEKRKIKAYKRRMMQKAYNKMPERYRQKATEMARRSGYSATYDYTAQNGIVNYENCDQYAYPLQNYGGDCEHQDDRFYQDDNGHTSQQDFSVHSHDKQQYRSHHRYLNPGDDAGGSFEELDFCDGVHNADDKLTNQLDSTIHASNQLDSTVNTLNTLQTDTSDQAPGNGANGAVATTDTAAVGADNTLASKDNAVITTDTSENVVVTSDNIVVVGDYSRNNAAGVSTENAVVGVCSTDNTVGVSTFGVGVSDFHNDSVVEDSTIKEGSHSKDKKEGKHEKDDPEKKGMTKSRKAYKKNAPSMFVNLFGTAPKKDEKDGDKKEEESDKKDGADNSNAAETQQNNTTFTLSWFQEDPYENSEYDEYDDDLPPLVHSGMERLLDKGDMTLDGSAIDPFHFQYFEDFQDRWRGFDTLARIAMGLGTYHMLQCLSYFAIAYFVSYQAEDVGGCIYVITFTSIQFIMLKLELFLGFKQEIFLLLLLMFPPFLSIAIAINFDDHEMAKNYVPVVYGIHIFYIVHLLYLSPLGAQNYFRATSFFDFLTKSAEIVISEKQATLDLFGEAEEAVLCKMAEEPPREELLEMSNEELQRALGNKIDETGEFGPAASYRDVHANKIHDLDDPDLNAITSDNTAANAGANTRRNKSRVSWIAMPDGTKVHRHVAEGQAFPHAVALEKVIVEMLVLFLHPETQAQLDDHRLKQVHTIGMAFRECQDMLLANLPECIRAKTTGQDHISEERSWIELIYYNDHGLHLPFFFSPILNENSWKKPKYVRGDVPSLHTLQKTVRYFQEATRRAIIQSHGRKWDEAIDPNHPHNQKEPKQAGSFSELFFGSKKSMPEHKTQVLPNLHHGMKETHYLMQHQKYQTQQEIRDEVIHNNFPEHDLTTNFLHPDVVPFPTSKGSSRNRKQQRSNQQPSDDTSDLSSYDSGRPSLVPQQVSVHQHSVSNSPRSPMGTARTTISSSINSPRDLKHPVLSSVPEFPEAHENAADRNGASGLEMSAHAATVVRELSFGSTTEYRGKQGSSNTAYMAVNPVHVLHHDIDYHESHDDPRSPYHGAPESAHLYHNTKSHESQRNNPMVNTRSKEGNLKAPGQSSHGASVPVVSGSGQTGKSQSSGEIPTPSERMVRMNHVPSVKHYPEGSHHQRKPSEISNQMMETDESRQISNRKDLCVRKVIDGQKAGSPQDFQKQSENGGSPQERKCAEKRGSSQEQKSSDKRVSLQNAKRGGKNGTKNGTKKIFRNSEGKHREESRDTANEDGGRSTNRQDDEKEGTHHAVNDQQLIVLPPNNLSTSQRQQLVDNVNNITATLMTGASHIGSQLLSVWTEKPRKGVDINPISDFHALEGSSTGHIGSVNLPGPSHGSMTSLPAPPTGDDKKGEKKLRKLTMAQRQESIRSSEKGSKKKKRSSSSTRFVFSEGKHQREGDSSDEDTKRRSKSATHSDVDVHVKDVEASVKSFHVKFEDDSHDGTYANGIVDEPLSNPDYIESCDEYEGEDDYKGAQDYLTRSFLFDKTTYREGFHKAIGGRGGGKVGGRGHMLRSPSFGGGLPNNTSFAGMENALNMELGVSPPRSNPAPLARRRMSTAQLMDRMDYMDGKIAGAAPGLQNRIALQEINSPPISQNRIPAITNTGSQRMAFMRRPSQLYRRRPSQVGQFQGFDIMGEGRPQTRRQSTKFEGPMLGGQGTMVGMGAQSRVRDQKMAELANSHMMCMTMARRPSAAALNGMSAYGGGTTAGKRRSLSPNAMTGGYGVGPGQVRRGTINHIGTHDQGSTNSQYRSYERNGSRDGATAHGGANTKESLESKKYSSVGFKDEQQLEPRSGSSNPLFEQHKLNSSGNLISSTDSTGKQKMVTQEIKGRTQFNLGTFNQSDNLRPQINIVGPGQGGSGSSRGPTQYESIIKKKDSNTCSSKWTNGPNNSSPSPFQGPARIDPTTRQLRPIGPDGNFLPDGAGSRSSIGIQSFPGQSNISDHRSIQEIYGQGIQAYGGALARGFHKVTHLGDTLKETVIGGAATNDNRNDDFSDDSDALDFSNLQLGPYQPAAQRFATFDSARLPYILFRMSCYVIITLWIVAFLWSCTVAFSDLKEGNGVKYGMPASPEHGGAEGPKGEGGFDPHSGLAGTPDLTMSANNMHHMHFHSGGGPLTMVYGLANSFMNDTLSDMKVITGPGGLILGTPGGAESMLDISNYRRQLAHARHLRLQDSMRMLEFTLLDHPEKAMLRAKKRLAMRESYWQQAASKMGYLDNDSMSSDHGLHENDGGAMLDVHKKNRVLSEKKVEKRPYNGFPTISTPEKTAPFLATAMTSVVRGFRYFVHNFTPMGFVMRERKQDFVSKREMAESEKDDTRSLSVEELAMPICDAVSVLQKSPLVKAYLDINEFNDFVPVQKQSAKKQDGTKKTVDHHQTSSSTSKSNPLITCTAKTVKKFRRFLIEEVDVGDGMITVNELDRFWAHERDDHLEQDDDYLSLNHKKMVSLALRMLFLD